MCIVIDRVKNAFLDRKKHLLEKQKVCELDGEEKWELEYLIDIYGKEDKEQLVDIYKDYED